MKKKIRVLKNRVYVSTDKEDRLIKKVAKDFFEGNVSRCIRYSVAKIGLMLKDAKNS